MTPHFLKRFQTVSYTHLYAYEMPPHLRGNHAGCAASHERVKHTAAFGTTGEKTGLNQLWRVGGIVTTLEGNSVDLPDIALIAERIDVTVLDLTMLTGEVNGLRLGLTGNGLAVFVAALHAALEAFRRCGGNRLGDCLVVKEILLGLGEQKDMLVAAGASVFDAFRHGVVLHPDDVVAQIPAGIAEGKSQHPRDADHVLRLATLNLVVESHSLTVSAVGVLRVNEIALGSNKWYTSGKYVI